MAFGVISTGFLPMTVDDVKAAIEADLRTAFGDTIDLSPQSNFGQLVGVLSERYADLWQLGQAIWAAQDPDAATGASLSLLASLSGTAPLAAAASTVTLTMTGTPGTVFPAGSAATTATGKRFATLSYGELDSTATAWAALTAYAVGDRRRNGTTQRIYLCDSPGTSAASGGPSTTDSAIVDGTVVWRYLGDGTGHADFAAECDETGPVEALAGTITTIATPISGWAGVTNILDATPGRDAETDEDLRLRRELELRAEGNAAVDAIVSDLLRVADVTAATVFENPTDTTDGDGLPPHSVECLVQGGLDAAVAAAIWASKAAGIATYGTTTEAVVDSRGNSHDVSFTRPTLKNVYVTFELSVDDDWPTDGEDQLKTSTIAYGDAQKAGRDVVSGALMARAFALPGVLDGVAKISFSNPPTATTTLTVGTRELAVYDSSRIVVTVTPGTP